MFSYRHAFHAGNHGDVLKHIALLATLRHLMRKPAPITLIDTHAGAGIYRLDGAAARTSAEMLEGVLRLQHWQQAGRLGATPPAALQDYLQLVRRFNDPADRAGSEVWRVYPGSPFLIHALATEPARAAVHDRMHLFELHPTEAPILRRNVQAWGRGVRARVWEDDGFGALRRLLPPAEGPGRSRRALVLMDPPYELKSDYGAAVAALDQGLQRFATGVYLIWYPVIARMEAQRLPGRLRKLAQQHGRGWLQATLDVGVRPAPQGVAAGRPGMHASGVFVINPPHTLAGQLEEALPPVLEALRRGAGADWSVSAAEP